MKATTWESQERTERKVQVKVNVRKRHTASSIVEALGVVVMIIFSLVVFKLSGLYSGIESPFLRVVVGAGITFWIVSSFRIAIHRRIYT
jgi:hypothetical protein